LEHWREPLWGRNHAQLFLHYNEKGGKYDIPYDGRPLLGMGSNFRTEDSKDKNDTLSHDADIIANQSENKVINTTQKIIY